MAKKKNLAAVELGRLGGIARTKSLSAEEREALSRKGGLKGAAARNRNLSAERRRELARKAGKASAEARSKKTRKSV
jgi:hypothetical protein